MAVNISKILAKYLKSSVFEREEYFLCLCDAFSKVLGNVSNGRILDLVECCLCLSHVFFYFSSIHIEGPRTKLSIFFSSALGGRGVWNENKKSRENLCIKQRYSFLKNKFTT